MSLAVLYSRALAGMDAPLVTVEVHLANGLPSFQIVGLPETEVKESKDRVRAALQTARFDLPIALGILAASGQIPAARLAEHEFAGELALTGELRPIRGALAMTLKACRDGRAFVLPEASAAESALATEAAVYPATSLLEVCAHLCGQTALSQLVSEPAMMTPDYPDFSEVKGQAQAKRALEIAAAGGHSVLMAGPPGTGKSMLAARFPGILPEMATEDALEAAAIASITGSFRLEN
jgi:magnesium chelatase family protein